MRRNQANEKYIDLCVFCSYTFGFTIIQTPLFYMIKGHIDKVLCYLLVWITKRIITFILKVLGQGKYK